MNLQLLQRDEIPLVWQIDRREIIENVCYLRNGELVLEPKHFNMQGWLTGEAEHYTSILMDCFDRGGTFWGAFDENRKIISAAVLESKFIGANHDTVQLKFLHVSHKQRKQGLGTQLFHVAVDKARSLGARKLYISATPS